MTRAIYVNPDPVSGRAKAASLSLGWFPSLPFEFMGAAVPSAIVDGPNGIQVFPEPLTPSQVAAAIAADVAIEQSAAQAQATLSANAQTIQGKAHAALATNETFQAIGAPTLAQYEAQIEALTRQVNGLIRLVIGVFDSTSDS